MTRCFEIFVAQIGDFHPKKSPKPYKCQNIYIKAFYKPKNIYIKANLKSQNIYIKGNFKASFVVKKWKNWLSQKVAQKFADSLGEFGN